MDAMIYLGIKGDVHGCSLSRRIKISFPDFPIQLVEWIALRNALCIGFL